MRCSAWSSLAISACSASVALVLAAPAGAHVIAFPTFLAKDSVAEIKFTGPNERKAPMTSFAIRAPKGLLVGHAHPVDGWIESNTDSTASWAGGPLAPAKYATFGVYFEANGDPGVVQITADQRYPDGSVVTWPISITIVPASTSPSQNLALAGVVGLIGVLVVAAVAMLALRRRPRRRPI